MSDDNQKQNVTVVDVQMPFLSIVMMMVKFAIASIPALIILMMIFSLVMMTVRYMFMGFGH